jgi:hypothetical protein
MFDDKSHILDSEPFMAAAKLLAKFPEAKIENAWFDSGPSATDVNWRLFVNVDRIVADLDEHLVPQVRLREQSRFNNMKPDDRILSIRQGLTRGLEESFETGDLERIKDRAQKLTEVVAELLETLANKRVLTGAEVAEIVNSTGGNYVATSTVPPAAWKV